MDRRTPLSEHLLYGEMVSPGDPTPPDERQLNNMRRFAACIHEPLRKLEGGKGIAYNSGFRSYLHNLKEGGAKSSRHVVGDAGDARTGDLSAQIKRAAKASTIPAVGGLGFYETKGILHLDGRPRIAGKIATWYQKANGEYITPAPEWILDQVRGLGGVNL